MKNLKENESNMPWLIDTIECMPDLSVLNLRKTRLGTNDMISFKRALTYGIPYLKNHIFDCRFYLPLRELDLSANTFHGAIGHLATALKCLPHLRFLKLGDIYNSYSHYTDLGAVDIQHLSFGLKHVPNLETLDLSYINISDAMVDLSAAINNHKNLHVLRLRGTDAKYDFILTFRFEYFSCFSNSCYMKCAYVTGLPSHLLCSRCNFTVPYIVHTSTVSRHQSTNIDKPRYELQTDTHGQITVFNQGIHDRFLCEAGEQNEYVNCLVTDNKLKALDMCRKLAESLNITLN